MQKFFVSFISLSFFFFCVFFSFLFFFSFAFLFVSFVSFCFFFFPFWAAAPKGSMTYAFTHIRDFLLLLPFLLCTPPHPPALRPISQPRGPNPSLEAQIPTSRPKSPPQGPNSSLNGFGPQDQRLALLSVSGRPL